MTTTVSPASTAMFVTLDNAVATYRAAAADLRGMEYRLHTGRASGNGATDAAIARHEERMGAAVNALVEAGQRHTVGLLVSERDLVARLAERKRLGVESPDLKARLADTRRALRAR